MRPVGPAVLEHYRFFGGKGGVGKTTCAAATAIALAEGGRSVLAVSLDPAHSLADALCRPLATRPRRIPTRHGSLYAAELDADAALGDWLAERRPALRRLLARGTYLDDDDIEELLRLSLPGVDELIGLIELTRLSSMRRYDTVVVDAAPTGHLLRLLAMPDTLERLAQVLDAMHAKHRYLAEALGGGYRPDKSDAVVAEIDAHAQRLAALLRDPSRCRVSWVLLPEAMALAEARDGVHTLGAEGIAVGDLIVNRLAGAGRRACPSCARRASYERGVVAQTRRAFPGVPIRALPALTHEPRGILPLAELGRRLIGPAPTSLLAPARRPTAATAERRVRGRSHDLPWLSAIAPADVRLLLFAGKGGVGKTSCAAAVALDLSASGRRVLLVSIDPAHSIADVLGSPAGEAARRVGRGSLEVRELDARALLDIRRRRYLQAVHDAFAALRELSRFDTPFDRDVVEHLVDLAPPGIDELLGLLEILESVRAARAARPLYDTVVVDTAPTGHTLRLLAMPRAGLEWVHAFMALWLKYRKVIGLGDLAWDLVSLSRDLRELGALLADPRRTRAVIVTRPADLPRLETARLIAGLRRLGIPLSGAVMNTAASEGCDRCGGDRDIASGAVAALRAELGGERDLGSAIIEAPTMIPPPHGPAELERWSSGWRKVA